MSTVQPVNTYRVYYCDEYGNETYTEHQARRIDVGIHGTLVMWGGEANEPRIVLGWAPGTWVHVELCE